MQSDNSLSNLQLNILHLMILQPQSISSSFLFSLDKHFNAKMRNLQLALIVHMLYNQIPNPLFSSRRQNYDADFLNNIAHLYPYQVWWRNIHFEHNMSFEDHIEKYLVICKTCHLQLSHNISRYKRNLVKTDLLIPIARVRCLIILLCDCKAEAHTRLCISTGD